MNLMFLLLAIALLVSRSRVSPSSYVKDQIFERLAIVSSNCIRLLNGTGSIGCQSNLKGNIGALVKISMPNDVQEAIKKLPLGINDLIVLVEMKDLHRELIDEIRTNKQVQGIILLNENEKEKRPTKFSEDSACPNRQFSIYKNAPTCHEWNAEAAIHPDGLKFLAFEKPIRFVQNRTEIDILVNKCANPYNKEMKADGFRCMGRMTAFMLAAGNAQLCMDRSQSSYGITGSQILCEPLSEWNVFSMLPPLGQKSNKTVRADQFVLAARMDTFSTDYNARNGDFSVLTSIIALLSIAQAIGAKMSEFLDLARQRQLLFAFFHGESLGHIGSSRWLWDMERGEFPHPPMKLPEEQIRQIGVDALSFFLELQQIGTGEQLFFHTDQSVYASNRTQINQLMAPFKDRVQFVDPSRIEYGSLPPGSFHSVLSRTSHVPGMVLSSFGKGNYTNKYLNSLFDMEIRENPNKFNSHVQRIAMAADVGLKAALQYVFNTNDSEKIDKFQINKTYVETLADCFFKQPRWECPLISGVVNATNDAKMRRWLKYTANDLYVGTAGHHFSSIRVVLYSLLVNSLGQTGPTVNVATAQQCKDQNKKQNVYTYVWQNDPKTNNTSKCYRTSIYMGQAQSPAFQIKNYDFANNTYSTWMESIQRTAGTMELYLKADYHLEMYALLLVLLVVLVSAPLSYGLKEQWFIDNTLPPASPQQL